MWSLARHARGLLVALVALTLTAGLALAGGSLPQAAADGLEIAAEAAGKTVPVVNEEETAEEEVESEEEAEETENSEEEAEETEESDSHGAVVSQAARMETPDGFRNHGHWVSCIARMAHGEGDEATDLTTITPGDCPFPGADEDEGEDQEEEEEASAAGSKTQARGRGAERSAAARAAAAARAGR